MSNCKPLPPQTYLQECFEYNPISGDLIWKTRPRHHFPTERGWKIFNTTHASKRAGKAYTNGYVTTCVNLERYSAHRVIWKLLYDEEPEQVDHKDGNRANNSLDNLRAADNFLNSRNRGVQSNNKSGRKGVYWQKGNQKWIARISFNGETKHLGCFDNLEDAAKAYEEAAIKYHGEFARTE